jgi:hypothetical protein
MNAADKRRSALAARLQMQADLTSAELAAGGWCAGASSRSEAQARYRLASELAAQQQPQPADWPLPEQEVA